MLDQEFIKSKAAQMRCECLEAIHLANSGHAGGCLSAADVLATIYYYKLNIDPKRPRWEDRDRFILSKGHTCPILYAILADKGYFDKAEIKKLRKIDSILQGAPNYNKTPGIDMSAGSLGQGLSVGVGMAIAGKKDNKDYNVYVMLGDGEMQEGQVWEAIMAANHFKLDNLIAILDFNHMQVSGTNSEVMDIGDPGEKFKSFGWNVIYINGHDIEQIANALDKASETKNNHPTAIISDTIKGKGVSFMEGKALWHGTVPNKEELEQALKELGGGK